MSQNIQVFVRCRPPTTQEKRLVVKAITERREIKVSDRNSSHDSKSFYFDQVFGPDAKQMDVYKTVVRPLIDQVLLGFNCTVFAYGQTGTGKTYTMEGDRSDEDLNWEEDPDSGVIPRAISQLFDTLKNHDNEFTVRVSFLELYNEDAYDLLSAINDTTKLKVFEDAQKKGSVIVGGLEEIIVRSKAEIYGILKRGSAKRQTAATLLNACSSRSHTIFSVTVHIREGSIEGEELLKIGKLNLVDLAGSENIGRSGAQDKRAREAGNINQSLLTLGRVITALVEKRPHVPYRESKLTRLLQDSLGGKTKTSIIATISPTMIDIDDTLSTLDYASRAKKITNKPEMNQRLTKKALFREYTREIERLGRELLATREKNGIFMDPEEYKEKEELMHTLQDENDKIQKLFEDFKVQYEQAKIELDQAQDINERQKRELNRRKKTETELFRVVENATNDNHLLHSKKERVENILKENQASIDRYHPKVRDDMTKLETMVELYTKELVRVAYSFHDKLNNDIVSNNEYITSVTAEDSSTAQEREKQIKAQLEQIDQLKEQASFHESQASFHESQAKEFRSKIENLLTDLVQNSNDQARQSKNEQALKVVNEHNSNLKHGSKESSEEMKQIYSTMNSTMKREFASLRTEFDMFLTRELKEDIKTGLTPKKKNYDIPRRSMLDSSFCDSILE